MFSEMSQNQLRNNSNNLLDVVVVVAAQDSPKVSKCKVQQQHRQRTSMETVTASAAGADGSPKHADEQQDPSSVMHQSSPLNNGHSSPHDQDQKRAQLNGGVHEDAVTSQQHQQQQSTTTIVLSDAKEYVQLVNSTVLPVSHHEITYIKTEPHDSMPPLSSLDHDQKHSLQNGQLQDISVAHQQQQQTIVLSDAKEYAQLSNSAVLQQHEIYIKTEPLDPMPPLASPATVIDVVNANNVVSLADKIREHDSSPPATVISLAPAQPYSAGATQLTFATPAYDISHNGQYAVQVTPSPQYTTVTNATSGHNNGGIVYLTTDYTYRDCYTTSTHSTATTDQYQTVRQHLASTPTVTYATSIAPTVADIPVGETSFLDRYLRGQPVTTGAGVTSNGTTTIAYGKAQHTIHGGLTVDLPSPDSGIGESNVTPRGENGALPPVR